MIDNRVEDNLCNAFINDVVWELPSGFFSLSFFFQESTFSLIVNDKYIGQTKPK